MQKGVKKGVGNMIEEKYKNFDFKDKTINLMILQ